MGFTYTEYINLISERRKIYDKNELIVDYCKNKKVLDLGCIDHDYETAVGLGNNWLHKQVKNVAAECIGLDILSKEAEQLNQLGYNIVCMNAESFDLNAKYDVIIAGDLIEHLSNIGLFLESVKKHMNNNSIFIVTTPNPFNIEQIMLAVFHKRIAVNAEHAVWLDPRVTWQLFERHHLNITDFYWINTRFHLPVYSRILRWIINPFSKILMRNNSLLNRDFLVIAMKTPSDLAVV